jgi:hypothetical protein
MIEAVRWLGFGARIVSGYLINRNSGLVGASGTGSTHAWAEIFLSGAGWITFDPTNRTVGDFSVIPVAVAGGVDEGQREIRVAERVAEQQNQARIQRRTLGLAKAVMRTQQSLINIIRPAGHPVMAGRHARVHAATCAAASARPFARRRACDTAAKVGALKRAATCWSGLMR